MNILITSAGRRVSLVKAFQAELKSLIPQGKVMTTDYNIKQSPACHVSDKAFQLPLVTDGNYIDLLMEICLNNNIKLIISTIDTELEFLANNKKLFQKDNIYPIVSSKELISICRDKRKLHDFLIKKNINIAQEFSKYDYKLPMFIKPAKGISNLDTFLITKQDELTEYHFRNEDLMFLEYIDHNKFDEFTCDLYYDKNHLLKCVVPRKRIETRYGEVSKGITQKNILIDYIKHYFNHLEGAIGCLTAQFFKCKESDKIYCIEINARFGGGFPLSYLAGANYPKWLIQEYLFNEIIEDYNDWEDNLMMLRYDEEILVHNYEE